MHGRIQFFFYQEKVRETTMRIIGFLHKLLSSVMHKKRLTTLTILVITVLNTKKLSLTELGRGIDLPIQERSGIRRADRFLGNDKLYLEREAICEVVIQTIVGKTRCPVIIVDWSNIPNMRHNVLRASLAAEGRAITLYEEVHPEKKLGNRQVQNKFLHKLKGMLSTDCKPLIITDGGFHNEWFREVVQLGWDYLGRIRVGRNFAILLRKSGKIVRYYAKKPPQRPFFLEKWICVKNILLERIFIYIKVN